MKIFYSVEYKSKSKKRGEALYFSEDREKAITTAKVASKSITPQEAEDLVVFVNEMHGDDTPVYDWQEAEPYEEIWTSEDSQ